MSRRRRTLSGLVPPPLITALGMLADDEISVPELIALVSVSQAPGCSVRDIVARWGLSKTTVSRACAALTERGVFEREPRDHQLIALNLSPAGVEIARQLHI